jgi:hypothetical protein
MPNKPIDMFKIRQILRLYADGRGSKFISKTTGTARNTIKKYLEQFGALGLTIADVEAMSAFFIEKTMIVSNRVADLEALLPELAAILKKRGFAKKMVYDHYIGKCPGGYKPSAFLVRLNDFMGMVQPSMRVPHKVGDKLFIDFTSKRLQIVDKETAKYWMWRSL